METGTLSFRMSLFFCPGTGGRQRAVRLRLFENIGYACWTAPKVRRNPIFLSPDSARIHLTPARPPDFRQNARKQQKVLVPAHIAIKGGVRFRWATPFSLAVGTQDGDRNLSQLPYRPGDGTKTAVKACCRTQ